MGKGENKVEQHLRELTEERAGKCWKWESSSINGLPDRLLFLPRGILRIVETKTIDGKLSPVQLRRHDELTARGFRVYTLDTLEKVDAFIERDV